MSAQRPRDLRTIIVETDLVDRALQKAVTRALIQHKRLGHSIVVWRDGKVVWIPAEEIEVPEEDQSSRS
jgi:hypothetical protein